MSYFFIDITSCSVKEDTYIFDGERRALILIDCRSITRSFNWKLTRRLLSTNILITFKWISKHIFWKVTCSGVTDKCVFLERVNMSLLIYTFSRTKERSCIVQKPKAFFTKTWKNFTISRTEKKMINFYPLFEVETNFF